MAVDYLADRQITNNMYVDHTMKVAAMPPIVLDAENVGRRTAEYLKRCEEDIIRPNLSSYALALGTTPDGLNEWMSDRRLTPETRNALLKGVSMIESIMIQMMMDQRVNPVSAIFILKNHFGYKDQSEISFKGHIETDKKALQAKYKAVVDDD